ncbi:amidase [Alphaproteobacteria bacterium]|nr:amidase [Alphaproteobacteria bacterium]
MQNNYHFSNIREIKDLYKSRDLNPLDLTKFMLKRISNLDNSLNSFIKVTPEIALEQAKLLSEEIEKGISRGPLHGIPFALKDLFEFKGVATTTGSIARKNYISTINATVTEKLIKAGAIILGKLAMTEGAFVEHVKGMQEPKNPWNTEYETGLSSSGSAVALSAGLCFGALGTDTGGSIRFPSLACGITGLKPTWGRVSRYGVFDLAPSLDHVGPMARNAYDVATILSVISGHDSKDKTSQSIRVPDYEAMIDLSIEGVTIGYDKSFCSDGVEKELNASIAKSLDIFSDLGAKIVDINFPNTDKITPNFSDLVSAEVALINQKNEPCMEEKFGNVYSDLIRRGRELMAIEYAALLFEGRKFTGALNSIFSNIDLILCPPWPGPAVSKKENTIGDLDDQKGLLRFTAPFNISHHPTITIPSGFNQQGMPLALQLVGDYFKEDIILRVANKFQQETSWHKIHPKNY